MRALAHPLRLRICQLFAERPRTTKQVAALIGEPPTRLYHHVHALEKAGLLRLRETRQKRGTQEKYYELVQSAPDASARVHGTAKRKPSPRRRAVAAALAVSALDVARIEAAAALADAENWEGMLQPLVARLMILSPADVKRIRSGILALIHRYTRRLSRRTGARPRGRSWALTLALMPSGPRPSATRRRTSPD